MSVSAQIRIRRDTAANFTSANPTLALGEIAYETDTRNFKVGDGTTAWTSLPYATNYRGNAVAPTSNVVIGPSAGANLVTDATDNVLLGSGAGDVLGASGRNIAIGTDALGAFSAGAASITNTTPGTGGSAGTYTGVVLVVESGGTMAVAPTVTLTVAAGGNVSAISITSPGSGASVASGIVFSATPTAGVPTNWRGTLASVGGDHIAIGNNALASAVPVVPSGSLIEPTQRIAIGSGALDAVTTGWANLGIGQDALGSLTVGSNNLAIGNGAGASHTNGGGSLHIGVRSGASANSSNCMTIGHNTGRGIGGNAAGSVIVGTGALTSGSTTIAPNATAIGHAAFNLATNVTGCTALGHHAGSYRGASGTTTLAAAENSIFIGLRARANDTGQTNQVVIGGVDACGDGSNTTVIGNTSTTSTRIPAGNLTLSNGNLVLGTAGNGIDFSADANAAGMTSELLDDYEEGTWTPQYFASTTGYTTPPTMNIQNARYTKVGRQVTVVGHIYTDSSNNAGGTGQLRISGLPFAAPSGNAGNAAGCLALVRNFAANQFPAAIEVLSSELRLMKRAASNTELNACDASDLLTSGAAANQIVFSCTYFT